MVRDGFLSSCTALIGKTSTELNFTNNSVDVFFCYRERGPAYEVLHSITDPRSHMIVSLKETVRKSGKIPMLYATEAS